MNFTQYKSKNHVFKGEKNQETTKFVFKKKSKEKFSDLLIKTNIFIVIIKNL